MDGKAENHRLCAAAIQSRYGYEPQHVAVFSPLKYLTLHVNCYVCSYARLGYNTGYLQILVPYVRGNFSDITVRRAL